MIQFFFYRTFHSFIINLLIHFVHLPSAICHRSSLSMGTTTSRPPPPSRTIHLTHPPPHHPSVPGYVADNHYTLEYTLLTGRHTVRDLLAMTQQHSAPNGPNVPKIVGVRRPASNATLSMATELEDGDRLNIVVTES